MGTIFLSIYLLINMVLMMNLLIAILSSTYSTIANQGSALYTQALIDSSGLWKFNPKLNHSSHLECEIT